LAVSFALIAELLVAAAFLVVVVFFAGVLIVLVLVDFEVLASQIEALHYLLPYSRRIKYRHMILLAF
jgi:hypothetical protein